MSPVFRYEDYHNPYAGSIADLLLRKGDVAAQAASQIGAANARAAEGSGQAFGGAIASTGNAIASQVQHDMDPQVLMAKRQVESAKRADAFNGEVNRITATLLKDNPDGSKPVDIQKAREQFAAANIPPAMQSQVLDSLEKMNASVEKYHATRIEHQADFVNSVLEDPHGLTPDGFAFHVAVGKANNLISDEQVQPIVQGLANGEDVKSKLTALRSLAPKYKDVDKPIALASGATLVKPTGETVASNPKPVQPVSVAPGSSLVNPQDGGVLYSAPAKKAFEQKNITIDGKANQLVNYDPTTGQMFIPGSDKPIDATRIKANTPPSIVIHNERDKAPNLPAWATDDVRPSGPDANKLDPSIRMTPNGLHQAALNYLATGQFPPTGRGSDAIAVAQRSAITSKVGAIAAASGMDEPALRAFYKANGASLAQQQKMYDSVQGFMATADKNADLLEKTLAKIPDAGSPLLNEPLRSVSQKAFGNVPVAEFKTFIKSVQNEYARIISQPNLAGQLTDSARHEAETLLDPNATVSQIVASVRALKAEGSNRLLSVGEQIQRIQNRMKKPGGGTDDGASGGGNLTPTHRFNPATGQVEKIGG